MAAWASSTTSASPSRVGAGRGVFHAIDARRLDRVDGVVTTQVPDRRPVHRQIALEEYEKFSGKDRGAGRAGRAEEEPVPSRSSIDSLISHLRNEEVEEIVTDVFEEMSYEVCVQFGSGVDTSETG